VLEADALRAEVKQALAEMRAGKTGTEGTREQATPLDKNRPLGTPAGNKTIRLTRVLVHIGKLCIGLIAVK
jgi:hypothetical protein